MTNYDRIRNMSVEEMAEYHTNLIEIHLNKLLERFSIFQPAFTDIQREIITATWQQHLESEVETE